MNSKSEEISTFRFRVVKIHIYRSNKNKSWTYRNLKFFPPLLPSLQIYGGLWWSRERRRKKEAMEETERRKEGGNGYQRGCGDGGQVVNWNNVIGVYDRCGTLLMSRTRVKLLCAYMGESWSKSLMNVPCVVVGPTNRSFWNNKHKVATRDWPEHGLCPFSTINSVSFYSFMRWPFLFIIVIVIIGYHNKD